MAEGVRRSCAEVAPKLRPGAPKLVGVRCAEVSAGNPQKTAICAEASRARALPFGEGGALRRANPRASKRAPKFGAAASLRRTSAHFGASSAQGMLEARHGS